MTSASLGARRRSVALAGVGLCVLATSSAAQSTVNGIVVDVGIRGGATVRWDAVAGATAYFVLRWNTGDAACCKKISTPSIPAATLSWQDELPQAGSYGYRVYATTATATYAADVKVKFVPGTVSSSIDWVEPPGSESIQQPASTTVTPTATANPGLLILKPAGPSSLTTKSLVPDGVGVLLTWSLVSSASSYRVYRTIAGSGTPGSAINWLDRGPLAPRGSARGIDPDAFNPLTQYTYWVEALLADGTPTAPSPVSTVSSQPFLGSVSNLRATVGGTTSIVMPGPLSVRGAVPGSYVTWEWDPLSAIYRYEISYELVGGDPQFGAVVERAIIPTVGEPPRFAPVSRPVPQGKSVKFCVATFPQGGDLNQPLAEVEFAGRTLPIGPVRCITTQVP